DILRSAGHDVFTPTLSGMGERAHQLTGDINLQTHIQDIVSVVEYERLTGVALVAHSYGGMVATGVADRITDKIDALIYLDAALPEDGQMMLDLVSADRRETVIQLAKDEGGGIGIPSSLLLDTGIEDSDQRAAFIARTCPHPLAAQLDPIRLEGNFQRIRRKAYVLAAISNSHRFRSYMEWARSEPGWVGEEIQSLHFPMTTQPRETADLLMRLAA
ncbi:MAG: alpha/beta hydrolase, partial [Verrucomicrobia bacterium]|nr:alpha/beta hydrolase [Verrucomicrobiota bacterium]